MIIEKQRKLQAISFDGTAGVRSRDIPRDTVLKRLQLRLSGSIVTTYATGTPVSRGDGILNSIVNNISVIANGGRVIKSVTPHFMRLQQLMATGVMAPRRSSAAAAAVLNPTVDQTFVFGTTTQTSSVVESVSIPFEMIWCLAGQGREATWFDTRQLASCELRLNFNAASGLQSQANTALVVYSASTLQVDITMVEAVGVLPNAKFQDFRQTVKQIPFTAESRNYQIEINRGNQLAGLLFYCLDGAAGSTTTATDRVPTNQLIKAINLKKNGSEDVKTTTFTELQNENMARLGINAPMVSNASILDGAAYMSLLTNANILTALDTTRSQVDSLFLFVDSGIATTEVSYTNPAFLQIMTDEICEISA